MLVASGTYVRLAYHHSECSTRHNLADALARKHTRRLRPAAAAGPAPVLAAAASQWTHSDVQLATIHLFESIAVQDILHSKDEQRAALTDLLAVSTCHSGAEDFTPPNQLRC